MEDDEVLKKEMENDSKFPDSVNVENGANIDSDEICNYAYIVCNGYPVSYNEVKRSK